MKNILSTLFICSFFMVSCAQNNSDTKTDGDAVSQNSPEVTTYYFIRHSEKDRTDQTNNNPHLNAKGKKRAKRWAKELGNIKFDAIYSTNYNRTQETATPLAEKNGLQIEIYDPSEMNDPSFLEATKGKTVLVVGHSNTTPMFANAILGEEKYVEMDDLNNANVYIVTIKDGNMTSEMRTVN